MRARLRKDLLATEIERRRAEEAITNAASRTVPGERPDQGVGSERGTSRSPKELAAARELCARDAGTVQTQAQSLEAARQSVRASATGLERLRVRFEKDEG